MSDRTAPAGPWPPPEGWSWDSLRAFALALGLPQVTDAVSWGQPNLKAHGRMWVWWSPTEQVACFKMTGRAARDFYLEADPQTFFVTPHYAPHPLLLVRAGRLDPDWARQTLIASWRSMAPKKLLAAFDAAQQP